MSRLNDITKFYAENLARYGGFSHKCIASYALGLKGADPDPVDVRAIGYHLRKEKISVQAFRAGATVESMRLIREKMAKGRKPSRVRSRRRPRKVA